MVSARRHGRASDSRDGRWRGRSIAAGTVRDMDATKTFTPRALILTVVVTVSIATGATLASAADKTEPIRRTAWGQTSPQNAPGQDLYLQRVVIDPGAKLPVHFHEGTQLATIRAGVLTYHVKSGEVAVTRADGKTETVSAPGTVKLRVGDTIVETESLVHYGENSGTRPVVIELAALLHTGAPLSTAVDATTPGTTALHLETALTSDSRTLVQTGAGNTITYGWNRLLGTATLNGQPVGVDMQGSVQYTSGNGPLSGFVTFTFADGSTLGVSMQGITTAAANTADATFATTLGVIGGTGTYVAAKGSGTFTGTRQTQLGGQVQAVFDLDLQGIG